jgi:capsular exopolysaccharide synthesis family protein
VDLRNFVRLLRDQWLLIGLVTVLAGACSAVLTSRMTREYSASVTFYVSAQAAASNDPIAAYEGALFSQQEVQSYANLLTGPRLAQSVIDNLRLPMSASALSSEISAHLIPQTVLLTATVTDTSPHRAQVIAQAVGAQFVKLVSSLERPPGKGPAMVRVTVVAPAALPVAPVSPQPLKNIAIAVGLGLLAGIGLVALRRALDTTVKSADQLTAITSGKPVLGSVPADHSARKRPLIADAAPFGPRAEAFRKLRTNLQFLDVDTPHKVLLVTSPLPQEGKSSTICNLAIALAQSGKRVILVEADLRRPRAASYLGLPGGAGVTSILLGSADISDVAQSWGDDLFTVLASGPEAPNPSELLGSQRMRQLVEELRAAYDYVLIDTPPVLPFADALATGPACDGALLVVRYGKTRVDQIRRAGDSLSAVGVTVLGTVLSMTSGKRDPGYGYGYYSRRRSPSARSEGPSQVSVGSHSAAAHPAALPRESVHD